MLWIYRFKCLVCLEIKSADINLIKQQKLKDILQGFIRGPPKV